MTVEQESITSRSLGASRQSTPTSAPLMEERVSVLVGDRLCHKCGYNLTGQNVLREPHYRMLIVRCPECATVASVQEYPLLGRWAGRWAMVLAGLAMIVILALWIGSGALIFGISFGVSEVTADRYRGILDDIYYTGVQPIGFQAGPAPATAAGSGAGAIPGAGPGAGAGPMTIQIPGQPPIVVQNVAGQTSGSFQIWWAAQDQAAIIAQAGGWNELIEWRALWLWVPLAVAAFIVGCVWAVILLARRRWSLLACGAGIMFVALLLTFFPAYEWFAEPLRSPGNAARAAISPPFMAASLAFAVIPLSVGLLLGRSVARGLVRLMLPPRLCSSLAVLWTVDGLGPPRNQTLRN